MNKEIVKKNFSKYARYYDRYSNIQNLCAQRLIAKIGFKDFSKILDIGCGTGNYTKLLREKFPLARIKAIDISPVMIDVAEEKLRDKMIDFIIADAEIIDFKERFDLVSSNASFQWFENLEKALIRYTELLDRDGMILFSIFGPLTFRELDESIKELTGEDTVIVASRFIEKSNVKNILKRLFQEVMVVEEIYKEVYDSLSELLKKIRYSGTRGNGFGKNGFWTPSTVDKLEKIYVRRHKEIQATYQVFFCKGVK